MSTNKTQNYQLNQWVKSDQVRMEDFNADNAKIDAALTGLNSGKADKSALNSLKTTVNGKASTSALNALQSTVSGKASQSGLDALSATVSGHTASLAKKGNAQLYTLSYTGNGDWSTYKSLTFPKEPWVIFIGGANSYLVIVRGVTHSASAVNYDLFLNLVTWSGKTVSWYHSGSGQAAGMMNINNCKYWVVALLQAD